MQLGVVIGTGDARNRYYPRPVKKKKRIIITDEEQRRIDRLVDDKYHEPLKAIVSLAKADPARFAELKAMYEARDNKEAIMASGRCNDKRCDKFQVVGGFCTEHAKEHGLQDKLDERNRRDRENAKLRKAAPEKVVAAPVAVPADFGKVVNADKDKISVGMISISKNEFIASQFMEALDAAWLAKRSQMLCALSGLDYKRSLRVQLDMLDAVDGLGEWA